jgi:hypothetical protein
MLALEWSASMVDAVIAEALPPNQRKIPSNERLETKKDVFVTNTGIVVLLQRVELPNKVEGYNN